MQAPAARDMATKTGFVHVIKTGEAVLIPGNSFVLHINKNKDLDLHGMTYLTLGKESSTLAKLAQEMITLRHPQDGSQTPVSFIQFAEFLKNVMSD